MDDIIKKYNNLKGKVWYLLSACDLKPFHFDL